MIKGMTAKEVMDIREQNSCGMYEARRILLRSRLRDAVNDAVSIDDLKEVMLEVLSIV